VKYIEHFIYSAGTLLLVSALVALLGNIDGLGHLHPHDPLLILSFPILLWIFCGLSIMVAWFCFLARNLYLQLCLIIWLSATLLTYQIGLLFYGNTFSAYLLDISAAFAIRPDLINNLLYAVIAYLLSGSLFSLFWHWYCQTPRMMRAATRFSKTSCPACGGHIQFLIQNVGRRIPCPHCQQIITLHKLEETLKMSCFFCQGHIEFPSHAIGEKMPCPHCKMDITLKEPA
jgi:hypothetical protein